MKTASAPVNSAFQKDLQRATRYRWVILSLMFLFYLINYADRANIGVVLPYIKKEFLLTNLQAGALASFFFLGYAISQVPAGLIHGQGRRPPDDVAVRIRFFRFYLSHRYLSRRNHDEMVPFRPRFG